MTGAAFALAAGRRNYPLPVPERSARVADVARTVTGTGLAAIASRFGSAAQLSGAGGALATGGPYCLTRDPQYLRLTAFLAGLALATRSSATTTTLTVAEPHAGSESPLAAVPR